MQPETAVLPSSQSVLGAVVDSVFAGDGVLARADPLYQPREGQIQMALAVSAAIESGGVLVAEAGTGVGKTYAYLVPVLLSGERALVSTATKALQDQLYSRDIPKLVEVLGIPVRIALLKGRSSYLCLHRLALARHDTAAHGGQTMRVLAKIEDWSHSTRAGDLSELTGLDERSPVVPLVTSTRDNCLGSQCPRAKECHVNMARREAMAADVVVVNHHLFFADVAVRESGVAELLPSVRVVIFDEAHQLNDTGVQFLGAQLTSGQIQEFARDVLAAGLLHARGFADWVGIHAALEGAVGRLSAVAAAGGEGGVPSRHGWLQGAPEGLRLLHWRAAMDGVEQVCAQALRALETFSEVSPDLARLAERGAALLLRLARFQGPTPQGHVRWMEAGSSLRLV